MVPNDHIFTIHFVPIKSYRGQSLYKGQDDWSQGVLYMEVPHVIYLLEQVTTNSLSHNTNTYLIIIENTFSKNLNLMKKCNNIKTMVTVYSEGSS